MEKTARGIDNYDTAPQACCMVCGGSSIFYFEKEYGGAYGLQRVGYRQCTQCGFVFSNTHYAMPQPVWEELNRRYHAEYQGCDYNPRDPRWLDRLRAQAACIAALARMRIVPAGSWVDWGCGDGKLVQLLAGYGLPAAKYDAYMVREHGYIDDDDLYRQRYSLVITTSVFEHLRDRASLERINGLVDEQGVLAVHTVVTAAIPQDPDWFYVRPPHCSFFTNRSMEILFDAWGYQASLYHVPSRLWFWFKQHAGEVEELLKRHDAREREGFYFKKGFVAYWQ